MKQYNALVRALRKYTGDAFTAKNGYDLRKPLTPAQRALVTKYARKVEELTARTNVLYRPRSSENKKEAFAYTGQEGYNKFTVAFVPKWNEGADLTFTVDKRRPKGSRFVAIDKREGSKQRFYHIPASAFINFQGDDEEEVEYIQSVLDHYAEDATFFLVQAGESYVWGSGGQPPHTARKIVELKNNYSAAMFDPRNKNSHYYGNWLHGVTGFTSRFDAFEKIAKARDARRAYIEKMHIPAQDIDRRFRKLKDGSYGEFNAGRFTGFRYRPGGK